MLYQRLQCYTFNSMPNKFKLLIISEFCSIRIIIENMLLLSVITLTIELKVSLHELFCRDKKNIPFL